MNLLSININEFFAGLKSEDINYVFLVSVVILVIWLIGVICDWKWTYTRSGGPRRNYLLTLIGPKAYRWLLGTLLFVMLVLDVYLFMRGE